MSDLKKWLRTTDRYVNILKEKWIETKKDFFYYFPKDYEDRTSIKTIWELAEWIKSVVKATIIEKNVRPTQKWKKLIEFKLEDENQNIAYASFMNNAFVLRQLKKWNTILISWKPKFSYNKWVFWFPEILSDNFNGDLSSTNLVWNIVPIYSDFLWIKGSWFQNKIAQKIWEVKEVLNEFLPEYLLKKYNLFDIYKSITNIHFPESSTLLQKAQYRFNFEKLLIWQIVSNYNFALQKKWEPTQPDRSLITEFLTKLPFELTNAQKKAIKKIIDDIHSGKTMARLLQWDVWSWKTIVSIIISYYIIKKFNKQVAFLAPTEVLAQQHILNFSKLFLPLWIKIALLTGSTKPKEKDLIKQQIQNGEISLVLWTHAIIQDDVIFKDLWLIIIDEQHKFWVNQRAKLSSQWNPHMLQMTATPIPRSLALSYFGEFENTVIDELPPGRKPIYTKVISENEYEKLAQFLVNKIQQWQQVYIVTPLIEESEKIEGVDSAFDEYEKITELLPKNIKIWLMHGKLKQDEKDKVMKDFKEWKTQVLVSTTVIEVWVDVPQATIMIIKNAERFGLSSLHQLRWRVWRWSEKSYCFLVTKSKSWESYRRLKYMEEFSDGFKLAEIDLKLRWAGTILWTQQSGQMDLPEEALKDLKLIEATRSEAKYILENGLLAQNSELNTIVNNKLKVKNIIS